MAYTGIDKEIYESGTHFRPLQEYTQQQWTPPEIMGQNTTTGITNTQAAAPYIWPPQGGGGGGGGGGLGGKWGNLDMSKSKMFDKNVFSMDMAAPGAPMTASHKPGQVKGFYNPQTGQYQTEEGYNINHLGVNVKPIFASMLESMGMGGKNKYGLDFKHRLGSTEGTFTHGLDSGIDKIKEGWEAEKEKFKNIGVLKKWRENKAIKKEKRIADEIKAANDAAAAANVQHQRGADIGGGWHSKDTGGGRAEFTGPQGQKHEGYSNTQAGYGLAASEQGSFAQGGRIGYRNGEFVDEDVNIQGPGFDVNENMEMAETSPFEIRIEELMDEGMSWEEAYQIASQEFSTAEGPEESFSQEGIASIV